MFEKKFLVDAINRSSNTELDRRKLLTMLGVAGVGAAGLATVGTPAYAARGIQSGLAKSAVGAADGPVSDEAILNFALNLEYLEAEFYLRAATGEGLPDNMANGGNGDAPGAVTGGRKVKFKNTVIAKYAAEIAKDEKEHVAFLRSALNANNNNFAVARPKISLDASFTAAAQAAGVVKPGHGFDPYASDLNFLFAAFLFEDVGVTAYKGAAPLISNSTYLGAAAGILAVEAYHAGIIRSTLYGMGQETHSIWATVNKLSDARDSLDGSSDDDKGIRDNSHSAPTLVPVDSNGIAFDRSPGQVLNIVYLTPESKTSGGFFPNGVNGTFHTSAGGPAA